MRLRDTFGLALTALSRNKMRSLLTTLGVVIGVSAVIMMQALGMGATDKVTGEIAGMGSNMLVITPGGSGRQPFGGSLLSAPLFERADLNAIHEECEAVRYAAATNSRGVNAVYGDHSRSTTLYGVTPDWYAVREWGVGRGRLLDHEDEQDVAQGASDAAVGTLCAIAGHANLPRYVDADTAFADIARTLSAKPPQTP